jgi:5-methylcytosine-specific restriction protein A
VEAHHLIPIQFQEQFKVSLDVPENVVALCPICHRKLHHAQLGEKTKILSPLLTDRAKALKGRGLEISSENLVSFYRAKLEEE